MSDDDQEPRKVITPVFGQKGGADLLHPDFAGKDEAHFDIAGTQVTLVRKNLFETDVDGFVIPQWEQKVSQGGIAYVGMQHFGKGFNDAYKEYLSMDTNRDKIARVVVCDDEESGKKFFHTVTVQTGHLVAAQNVFDAVTIVLQQSEEDQLSSVGFPAMCTGRQGELLDEQSAKTIANAIYRLSFTKPSSVHITIAIDGYGARERFKAFKDVLSNPNLYQEFDPSQEVGQRTEDVRRTLAERRAEGKSGIVVIDKEGRTVGDEAKGGTVHHLFGNNGPKPRR